MNLIDAIKSGRPYRRPDYAPGWQFPDSIYSFAHVDIVADDWEIQEPTVTITRSQFWKAVHEAPSPAALARALGLENE